MGFIGPPEEMHAMPAVVEASAVANVSKETLWNVLADFPNIADYVDSVKASAAIGEQDSGVGATRHCNFAGVGAAEEEIIEFETGDRLVILLYKAFGMPMKQSVTTFSLTEIDPHSTRLTMRAEIEAKGGLLSPLVAKLLERRLPKAAQRTVTDLTASAERVALTT